MNFIKKITQSGIPLYVLPIPGAHSIASGVLVNVGSRDEKLPEEGGLAHAFEHMFGMGSKKFPNKKLLAEYVEEIGGWRNALTDKELTFFYNQVPANAFERSIDVLSEQIQYSLIPKEKISTEMQVVIEELRKTEDNPERFIQEITYENIFKNHPLGHSVLGTKESLLNIKRENFFNFIDRYYYPGNYTFVIAGKISPEESISMIDKYFTKKIEKLKEKKQDIGFTRQPQKEVVVQKKINQVHINLAVPIIQANNQEKMCLRLYSWMIGVGMSSPLFEEVRTKRGLCYVVQARYGMGTDLGLFRIYMGTRFEKYKEAIKLALSIAQENKDNTVLLDKAKRMMIGRLALKYENTSDIIQNAIYEIIYMGKPHGLQETNEAIKDITIEDIEKTVDKFLKPENFTTILLMPEDAK